MLAPEDRELLIDAVRPEPGYSLDHALITTYSLDLDALLSIPLALTFDGWSGEMDDESSSRQGPIDPVALLESLRRHSGRLTVLCQAGAVSVPRSHSFLSFLEPVVHGVTAPLDGVFHPKFWLLRYLPKDADGPTRYRLLVLSRNLTYDRSWDTMLRLDATFVERRRTGFRANRPLQRFMAALIELAAEGPVGLGAERRSALETIAGESARLQFELPEGVEECTFWPLGFDRTSVADVFERRRDRTLVVSPFLTPGFIEQLGLGGEDILVSSDAELAGLPDALRERIGRVEVMEGATTVELESGDDIETSPAATAEDGLSGLHAKLFVADAGWKARVWTGSANATAAAFEKNVEFVTELFGEKGAIGIEKVLGSSEGGLAKLLVPYQHDPAAAPDPETRRLEQLIDGFARGLGASPLSLHASPDGGAWRLDLTATGELPPIPAELEVRAWPATLQEHRSRPLGASDGLPAWEGLDVVQLTGFLCLEIFAAGAGLARQVAIAIPLEGAPADRDTAVVRSILADPGRVLRYLLFLLGDHDGEEADAFEMLISNSDEEAGASSWLGLGSEATLFEALVRSLHRDPDRIDRVEVLIRDLGDDASDVLPKDFQALFATVRDTRRRLLR